VHIGGGIEADGGEAVSDREIRRSRGRQIAPQDREKAENYANKINILHGKMKNHEKNRLTWVGVSPRIPLRRTGEPESTSRRLVLSQTYRTVSTGKFICEKDEKRC
jgi:hypothetical protein